MSWVTDVILLAGLEERFPESGELRDEAPAIAAINAWLESRELEPLVPLDEHIGMNSGHMFQAVARGAALNFLDIPGFLEVVGKQKWQTPQSLLLLLKDEEDREFTVFRIRRHKLEKC
jgi:hypothetical protein